MSSTSHDERAAAYRAAARRLFGDNCPRCGYGRPDFCTCPPPLDLNNPNEG